MKRLLSPSFKYLALILLTLFFAVSCAPQPQGRSIMHVYEKNSSLMAVSLYDIPQGTQVTAISFGGTEGQAKRPISKSEFESIWNRLNAEDLSRYKLHDKSTRFDTVNNIVVKFGTLPDDMPNYVVPKKQASASLKAVAESMKKLSPL